MENSTETVLEIDLHALDQNYQYLKSHLKPSTKFMAVVKAFAYGSDAVVVSKELESLGADYLAVAYTSEGETIRKSGVQIPILVLHSLPFNFDGILRYKMEPSMYSKKSLTEFIEYAERKNQKSYPVHLKFNTGLNRLGFEKSEIPWILETLQKTASVRVVSLFSHLAASEDLKETDFTSGQIAGFEEIAEAMISGLGYRPLLHCTNTSGILNFPQAHFDMVRSGIGLYGFGNDPRFNRFLKPIATLKTIILQIHSIEKGESVGYNRGFFAEKPTRSATLPVGHADGLSRAYGNGKGWVSIKGKKAPILGNVCMDMIMVDVTEIDCEEGDEAIVFGEFHSAEKLAGAVKSIPYELITAISQRIKREVCRKEVDPAEIRS